MVYKLSRNAVSSFSKHSSNSAFKRRTMIRQHSSVPKGYDTWDLLFVIRFYTLRPSHNKWKTPKSFQISTMHCINNHTKIAWFVFFYKSKCLLYLYFHTQIQFICFVNAILLQIIFYILMRLCVWIKAASKLVKCIAYIVYH